MRLQDTSHRVHTTDPIEMNRQNWDERATIHARDTTGDYMLDRFRAGEDALHEIEAAELGDISGKRVLHLQCHIGRDTLCLVRRGATVTGLDFSSAALNVARRLSDETGLKADFVEGTVDQTPDLAPGPFDDEHGITIGTPVKIMAESFGKEPSHGELIAATASHYSLQRTDLRAGTVHVHFPRIGYVMKTAHP